MAALYELELGVQAFLFGLHDLYVVLRGVVSKSWKPIPGPRTALHPKLAVGVHAVHCWGSLCQAVCLPKAPRGAPPRPPLGTALGSCLVQTSASILI